MSKSDSPSQETEPAPKPKKSKPERLAHPMRTPMPVPVLPDASHAMGRRSRQSLLAHYLDTLGGLGGTEWWQTIASAARGELRGFDRATGKLEALPTVAERVDAAKFILAYQHGRPKDTVTLEADLTVSTKWDPSKFTKEQLAQWAALQALLKPAGDQTVNALPTHLERDGGHD